MNEILKKLIAGDEPDEADLENALHDICEDVHASCNDACPVFEKFGDVPNMNKTRVGCDCFKNGAAMLRLLREA